MVQFILFILSASIQSHRHFTHFVIFNHKHFAITPKILPIALAITFAISSATSHLSQACQHHSWTTVKRTANPKLQTCLRQTDCQAKPAWWQPQFLLGNLLIKSGTEHYMKSVTFTFSWFRWLETLCRKKQKAWELFLFLQLALTWLTQEDGLLR